MKLNPRDILWRLNRYEFDFWHLTFIAPMLIPSFGNPLILAQNRSKLRDSSGIIQTIIERFKESIIYQVGGDSMSIDLVTGLL